MGKHFISGNIISYDSETVGVDFYHGDRPFAYSFANLEGETAYFEWPVDPFTRRVTPVQREVAQIKAILEDPGITKIAHNKKFDDRMSSMLGITVRGAAHDTYIAARICNSREIDFGLKSLCKKYGAMESDDQDDLKKLVSRLRRRVKNIGWNIAYKHKPQPHGDDILDPLPEADYWIPREVARLLPEKVGVGKGMWMTKEEAGYCETYAIKDAQRNILLWMLYQDLLTEYGLWDIYNFEMQRVAPLIERMEVRGIRAFKDKIRESKAYSLSRIDDLRPKLVKVATKGGMPDFDPDNDNHIRKFVIDVLKLDPPIPKGKKLPSCGREFLQANLDNPSIHEIARYRTAVKTYKSFFAKFENFLAPDTLPGGDNVIHASFNQIGADTGRLSCRDPNLQNVMDPTVSFAIDPQHVRHVFGPRKGFDWLCIDYSNMEVRVFADIAQEPVMLAAIREGRDIHSAVANQIWGGKGNMMGLRQAIRALSLDGTGVGNNDRVVALWKEWGIDDPLKLTENQRYEIADHWLSLFDYDIVKAQDSVDRRYARNVGKMVTFLKVYGGGLPGARKLLKDENGETLPDRAIGEILKNYDSAMPRIKEYSRELIGQAVTDGYITTRWGRRLMINPYAPYQAVNYMVQGTSADLMKYSMVRCDDRIREDGDDAFVISTIHDELIFEVRREAMTRRFIRKMCSIMEDPDGHLSISMPVDPKIVRTNWSQKLKLKYDWRAAA